MKNVFAYFVLIPLLFLGGCARTPVASSPPVPVAEQAGHNRASRQQTVNQPVSRAEIAQQVYVLLLQARENQDGAAGNNGFVTPAAMQAENGTTLPGDIKNHPLFLDIVKFLSYNFRGLTVDGTNSFQPDKPLSRAAFALLAEDILARMTGDDQLTRRYIGNVSPFADVPDDYFALNAIFVVTARGIMHPDADSRFRPAAPITRQEAADALNTLSQGMEKKI